MHATPVQTSWVFLIMHGENLINSAPSVCEVECDVERLYYRVLCFRSAVTLLQGYGKAKSGERIHTFHFSLNLLMKNSCGMHTFTAFVGNVSVLFHHVLHMVSTFSAVWGTTSPQYVLLTKGCVSAWCWQTYRWVYRLLIMSYELN